MEQYDTLSQAMNSLKKRGYNLDFSTDGQKIISENENLEFKPEDIEIDEVHRFEGMTNPGDMSVLYAITSSDGHKGLLADAYGTYGNEISPELARKLSNN